MTEDFVEHFNAEREVLVRNYRSAPELVRIQNELARVLEDEAIECESAGEHEGNGVCQVLTSPSAEVESEWIADQVEAGIAAGLTANDFCLIYRQRVATLSKPAIKALEARDIRARDETLYQDILDEPAIRLIVSALRLAEAVRDASAWAELIELVQAIHGLDDDDHRTARWAVEIVRAAKQKLAADPTNIDKIEEMLEAIVDSADRYALKETIPAYSRSGWLEVVLKRAAKLLEADRERSTDWSECVSVFEGIDIVRAMTIHKSKGLEYDTVIFVGLEDSSWWAYARQEEEERRAFFVAFSRAIERVVFTFARKRDSGRGVEQQRRQSILSMAKTPSGVSMSGETLDSWIVAS